MSNISITGAAIDGDPDTYWLNLYDQDGKWNAGEPGGGDKISHSKAGKWLFKAIPDKGIYINDNSGAVVFFIRNLDPQSVKVGDAGQGHAYETARIIKWRVDSL